MSQKKVGHFYFFTITSAKVDQNS